MKQDSVLQEKAKLVRKLILQSTTQAGSGHPTSSLSATDITTVLFYRYFRYDLQNPLNPDNDRFVLSKGHASPLFYALYAVAGAYPLKDLLSLREFGSRFEGHPPMDYPYTDAATGSLGQGLSVGAGLAYLGKQEKRDMKSFVLLGDGEVAEGQVWEAANFASYYKLNNLIAIVDVNRLGQSQQTMFGHELEEYIYRFSGFGFEVLPIDGHKLDEIDAAFAKAEKSEKPVAIIARTKKGKGVSFIEDKDGWHGKALPEDMLVKALKELGGVDDTVRFTLKKPVISRRKPRDPEKISLRQKPDRNDNKRYKKGESHATREVYGAVLSQLGYSNPDIYALDAEVKNSTFSQDFLKDHPERFIECFIAEQNMVGVAVGLQRLGKKPFVSSFAAFLTRAFDQIRMAAVSRANIAFVGSHAGVSIGEDGPSQMGLEDITMFGVLPDSVVLHPSDAVSTAALVPQLVSHKGISYLRTLRPKTSVLYDAKDKFVIGGSKILRFAQHDKLTIVAAGITVHEALKAYDALKKKNIVVRVIDCYSIKPIDTKTLQRTIGETEKNIIVTVEDHFEHGGLGDFVLEAVSGLGTVHKLSVRRFSRSGKGPELLRDAGIDSEAIVSAVEKILKA